MHAILRFALLPLVALAAAPAQAADAPQAADPSAQATALGQCFVAKSTGEDRIAVARWMLAAIASAPKMADVTRMDAARKAEIDKAMAALFTRLITVDCASQSRPLFLAKNKAGFETAGGALGTIAMQELMSDPKAAEGLAGYVRYLDERDFVNVTK